MIAGVANHDGMVTDMYDFIDENSPVHSVYYPDIAVAGTPTLTTEGVSYPTIVVLDHEALQERWTATTDNVTAFYDPIPEIIYLSSNVDLDTVYGKSVLVHELVHHVQYKTDATEKVCATGSMLDGDAYKVQANYLKEHGETGDVYKAVNFYGAMLNADKCFLDKIRSF